MSYHTYVCNIVVFTGRSWHKAGAGARRSGASGVQVEGTRERHHDTVPMYICTHSRVKRENEICCWI